MKKLHKFACCAETPTPSRKKLISSHKQFQYFILQISVECFRNEKQKVFTEIR